MVCLERNIILGAPLPRENYTGNINEFYYGCAYIEQSTSTGGFPYADGFLLAFKIYNLAPVRLQLAFNKISASFRVQWFSDTWTNWVSLT